MGRRSVWDDWLPLSVIADPEVEPSFPLWYLTPRSTCNHKRKPIMRGSVMCCMVCHQYGKDRPLMPGVPVGARLNEDYEPDPQPTKYVAPPKTEKLTRKQSRAIKAAEKAKQSQSL